MGLFKKIIIQGILTVVDDTLIKYAEIHVLHFSQLKLEKYLKYFSIRRVSSFRSLIFTESQKLAHITRVLVKSFIVPL